ncbi:unnamed protein product [Prunus armeniaca]
MQSSYIHERCQVDLMEHLWVVKGNEVFAMTKDNCWKHTLLFARAATIHVNSSCPGKGQTAGSALITYLIGINNGTSHGHFKASRDDCLLFVRATSKAANNISNLLENFSTASGQKINLHKSTVFFSANVHNRAIITLSNLLQIQHKTTLGRYLGIHNIVSWKDPDNTKLMIKRIRNKFAGWKAQTLSRAGRLTLIKASYGNKIPQVSWKDIYLPKPMGGLGVRSAAHFNQTWNKDKLLEVVDEDICERILTKADLLKKMWRITMPPKCHFVISIWRCTSLLPLSILQDFDCVSWLSTLSSTSSSDGLYTLTKALLICWQIWDTRNKFVFQDISPHLARVLHVAGQIGMDYWKLNFIYSSSMQQVKNIKWEPPPMDWIKINFDGSVRNNKAATGFIIWDWNGHVLLAGTKNAGQASVTIATFLALRDSLAHAIHNGLRKIVWMGTLN